MAVKKETKKKAKNKGGRPPEYKPEYTEQAYKLAMLGATDAQVADFFGKCEKTIYLWKERYPEFLQALKDGKTLPDAEVAVSLFKRATGYSHDEEKVFCSEGEIVTHTTTKHYPPDTGAAMAWLKNRQREHWKDRHDVEVNIVDDLANRLSAAKARAKK